MSSSIEELFLYIHLVNIIINQEINYKYIMANKFLGLDSINVLKQYIDDQIMSVSDSTRIITIQAYSYQKNGVKPSAPVGGGFDTEGITIQYPEGWYALNTLLNKYEDLETALSEGSIWMTAGVSQGTTDIVWSTPMKISGQNGVSVRFAYSYDKNAAEEDRLITPPSVDSDPEHHIVYAWTQTGEDDWVGPVVWAMYAQDATMVYWRYCITGEDEDGKPITPPKPGGAPWVKEIPRQDITEDMPYMWMSYQIVRPKKLDDNVTDWTENDIYKIDDSRWSEPILFGHYGRNGDVPDYTQNLYCKGIDSPDSEIKGIIAPEQPKFEEDKLIDDYITEDWLTLPTDDEGVWWMCTFKIKGRNNEVLEVGPVKRYNGVDGVAKPGPFVKYLYAWSADQKPPITDPEVVIDGWRPDGWYEKPDYDMAEDWEGEKNSEKAEASLWSLIGQSTGFDENGHPIVSEWSAPIKLTGPRGPISYDYRIETRYMEGTSAAPRRKSTEAEWNIDIPQTTSQYPYIWAQQYLVYYKMKYADTPNPDGTYDVVEDTSYRPDIIKSKKYGEFRLTGLNGEDGNKKNNIKYTTSADTITVNSFTETNYYISDNSEIVTYNMNLDTISFIDGYTGKFSNVGTGVVILNGGTFRFIGSCNEVDTIILDPQETVELICYNADDQKKLIVVGKSLTPETPVE